MCHSVSCQNGQACMVKEVKPLLGGLSTYTLGCEQKSVCDGTKKRSIQSRSVHIDCCLSDLCNNISPPTTPMPTTKSSFTTTPIPSQNAGHWSEWSIWGPCRNGSDGKTGYKERTRVCNIQQNNISPTSCLNGSTEYYRAPCTCTPPRIVNFTASGTWKIGGVVYLRCVTTGNPKPSVNWLTLSTNILPVQMAGNDSSSLMIGPITHLHDDLFKCDASNSCGKTDSKIFTAPSASSPIIG
ncbi:uncharacterized protein LOC123539154 [Mercenaria mercenaria]|uniref:uncharacterized protein LOC123539154 n=1 Tax=Mercenaria mercenaria TaxID=6596 RepID=UPI00234E7DBA|nr:uncharacterized protein LOC123539154 [Mercenaria mercenaria]